MTTQMEDPGALLRTAGLRVTSPRLAVLAVVDSRPHIAAEDVAVLVRERLGAVSTQTVYDALRVCTDVGLMRRIEPAGSPARYERRTGDNHHHLVCRQCGRIEDVECAVGHAPCLQADHDHGFQIDEAEVNYWGTCPECQAGRARLG
ncbi:MULTISPECIES: Fur family transcriptional regulator [unclassified Dietzia]|uniref:Fur family transcriptional regulator n=1 Tax=unclassified Dietzia TaxID=2617939 RepID=UPI0015FA2280|nr:MULTISPECIES: Fur family transcriptional regulator [unclassified Dietzia]MBB1041641.1 transcriptional repressor [Dietzia sp. Cai40]MBB1043316.1 transcriptional repressor [Dietzia sp. DQ11-44]